MGRQTDINRGEVNRAINSRLGDVAYILVAYKDGTYEQFQHADVSDPAPSDPPPSSFQIAYVQDESVPGDPCIYINFGGGWEKICW